MEKVWQKELIENADVVAKLLRQLSEKLQALFCASEEGWDLDEKVRKD